VWSVVVVVILPDFQFLPGIVQRDKLVDIEELVAQQQAHPTNARLKKRIC
jgi:hypothetical protein